MGRERDGGMRDGSEGRNSVERRWRYRVGREWEGGKAVIRNVGETRLESSYAVSLSLPPSLSLHTGSHHCSLTLFMPRKAWTSKKNYSTGACQCAFWVTQNSTFWASHNNCHLLGFLKLNTLNCWSCSAFLKNRHLSVVSALARRYKKYQKTSEK